MRNKYGALSDIIPSPRQFRKQVCAEKKIRQKNNWMRNISVPWLMPFPPLDSIFVGRCLGKQTSPLDTIQVVNYGVLADAIPYPRPVSVWEKKNQMGCDMICTHT